MSHRKPVPEASVSEHRRYTHKKVEMADVDTADIGPQLAPAYEFIETAMAGKKGERHKGAAASGVKGCSTVGAQL